MASSLSPQLPTFWHVFLLLQKEQKEKIQPQTGLLITWWISIILAAMANLWIWMYSHRYAEHSCKGRCWVDQWFGLGKSWANWFSRGVEPMGHGTELGLWQCHRARHNIPLTCPVPFCVCTSYMLTERTFPFPSSPHEKKLFAGWTQTSCWMIFIGCAVNLLSWESKCSFSALWCDTSQGAMDTEFTPPGWAMPALLLFMKITLTPHQPWDPHTCCFCSWPFCDGRNKTMGKKWEEFSPKIYSTAGWGELFVLVCVLFLSW